MVGKGMMILGASLALVAQPVAAQESEAGQEQAMAELMALFEAEPLSAEQQARLPAARAVVERILPPGTMAEVMGSMFDGMLGPIMEMAIEPSSDAVASELGLEDGALDLSEEQAAEAAAILDPA